MVLGMRAGAVCYGLAAGARGLGALGGKERAAAILLCHPAGGVRRRGDHAQDLATLTPVQVIVTGIIAGVLFVLSLVLLVVWITG